MSMQFTIDELKHLQEALATCPVDGPRDAGLFVKVGAMIAMARAKDDQLHSLQDEAVRLNVSNAYEELRLNHIVPGTELRLNHVPGTDLTPREREVLALVAEGWANKQIAAELHISSETVKEHVKNILQKLRVHNRTQAATWAIRNWMTKPSH